MVEPFETGCGESGFRYTILRFIIHIMKRFLSGLYLAFLCLAMIFVASLFSGCYAYLKADKLVYAGTVAKAAPEVCHVDSVDSVRIVIK